MFALLAEEIVVRSEGSVNVLTYVQYAGHSTADAVRAWVDALTLSPV